MKNAAHECIDIAPAERINSNGVGAVGHGGEGKAANRSIHPLRIHYYHSCIGNLPYDHTQGINSTEEHLHVWVCSLRGQSHLHEASFLNVHFVSVLRSSEE